MLIQGSNNPLVITFDQRIEDLPALVVSLWRDPSGYIQPIKVWQKNEMTITGDTAICELTEADTKDLPEGALRIEAKGLNDDGSTIFWDKYVVDVLPRKDRSIDLVGGE